MGNQKEKKEEKGEGACQDMRCIVRGACRWCSQDIGATSERRLLGAAARGLLRDLEFHDYRFTTSDEVNPHAQTLTDGAAMRARAIETRTHGVIGVGEVHVADGEPLRVVP